MGFGMGCDVMHSILGMPTPDETIPYSGSSGPPSNFLLFGLGFAFGELDLGRCKAVFLNQHDVGFSFQDRFLVRVG